MKKVWMSFFIISFLWAISILQAQADNVVPPPLPLPPVVMTPPMTAYSGAIGTGVVLPIFWTGMAIPVSAASPTGTLLLTPTFSGAVDVPQPFMGPQVWAPAFKNASGSALLEYMKANREKMKANVQEFKDTNGGWLLKALSWSVSDVQKQQIKTIRDNQKSEIDTLVQELKWAKWDESKVKEITDKIEQTRQDALSQIQGIVGADSELGKVVEERTKVFETNKALREENRTKRAELRAGIEEQVVKYKDAFIQKISGKLDKMKTKQVEKLVGLVDKQLAKVEANTKISADTKSALKSKLVALRETLQDKIDTSATVQDTTDVQALLDSVTQ